MAGILTASIGTLVSGTSVPMDAFVDFETSSAGTAITAAILNACTKGSTSGTWSLVTSPVTHTSIDSGNYTRITPVLCNGITYTGAGTRRLKFDQTGAPAYDSMRWTPSATFSNIVISAIMEFNSFGSASADVSFDHISINSSGFAIIQQHITQAQYNDDPNTAGSLRPHSNGGFGPEIPIVRNTPYAIAHAHDVTNNRVAILILKASDASFVGASNFTLSGATVDYTDFQDYLNPQSGAILSDSIGFDWTNHTFPPDPYTLPAPTSVVSTQTGNDEITITWASGAILWKVERSLNGGSYSTLNGSYSSGRSSTATSVSFINNSGLSNSDVVLYRITSIVDSKLSTTTVSNSVTIVDVTDTEFITGMPSSGDQTQSGFSGFAFTTGATHMISGVSFQADSADTDLAKVVTIYRCSDNAVIATGSVDISAHDSLRHTTPITPVSMAAGTYVCVFANPSFMNFKYGSCTHTGIATVISDVFGAILGGWGAGGTSAPFFGGTNNCCGGPGFTYSS